MAPSRILWHNTRSRPSEERLWSLDLWPADGWYWGRTSRANDPVHSPSERRLHVSRGIHWQRQQCCSARAVPQQGNRHGVRSQRLTRSWRLSNGSEQRHSGARGWWRRQPESQTEARGFLFCSRWSLVLAIWRHLLRISLAPKLQATSAHRDHHGPGFHRTVLTTGSDHKTVTFPHLMFWECSENQTHM